MHSVGQVAHRLPPETPPPEKIQKIVLAVEKPSVPSARTGYENQSRYSVIFIYLYCIIDILLV